MRMLREIGWVVAGTGLLAPAAGAQAPAASPSVPPPPPLAAEELVKRVDTFVRPFVEDGHLSGTVLVARAGEVVYERSFGMANYELGVPNTPQTRFAVASITKPITVMLLAQLVEAKKLARSDTLEKWIPGFPSGDKITIDHLLNHRAGIPHRVTEDCDENAPQTAASMVELARRRPLQFVPGARSSYSSAGYSVLTRVLELAAGSLYSTPRDLFRLLTAARAGALGEAARQSVVARPRVA